VVVGVAEPGDTGSVAGGGPDAVGRLFEEVIAEELDAARGEIGDGGVDVRDLPAEDGELERGEVAGADDAEHGAVGVKDESEVVLGDETQAEGFGVEGAGACGIAGGDEGDDG